MKIEDATFSVRVKLKEEGIGPDQIQWLEKEGWSISERRGVSVASQKFDPIIDAGWVVLLSVSDAAHFSELLRNFPATIKDEVLVAISVYFAEDECEFSVDESILTICVENKSRLWVHTLDWRRWESFASEGAEDQFFSGHGLLPFVALLVPSAGGVVNAAACV